MGLQKVLTYSNCLAIVDAYGGFEKCAYMVIDGVQAMTGKTNGLVGILKDCGVDCPTFHCIIQHKALCSRFLYTSNVIISVTNIINIIKG